MGILPLSLLPTRTLLQRAPTSRTFPPNQLRECRFHSGQRHCPAFFVPCFFGLDLPGEELDWANEDTVLLLCGRQPYPRRLRRKLRQVCPAKIGRASCRERPESSRVAD